MYIGRGKHVKIDPTSLNHQTSYDFRRLNGEMCPKIDILSKLLVTSPAENYARRRISCDFFFKVTVF